MRLALVAPALLALIACGAPQDAATPEAPAATPAAPGTEAGTEPGFIPARFHGVWDADGGKCAPGSEMRIEISGRHIAFHEALGSAAGVNIEGGDVIADLVMEGEGQTELRIVKLQLTSVGGREALLLLPGLEGEVPLRPVPHFRCPE